MPTHTLSKPPQSALNKIRELSKLNVVQDVCRGRRQGVEENIKTGITLDLLEALGWERRNQMDFEHDVGPKSADIALIKNETTHVITETKSLEKRLENHKSQGMEYARTKGIVWTLMTNGINTQLYKSAIAGVSDEQNEPIFESSLVELPNKFERLYQLIGEPNIENIEQQTEETVDYIRQKISEKEFLVQLLESKQQLYYNLRQDFDDKYGVDSEFTDKIDSWLEAKDYDKSWDWKREFRNDSSFADFIVRIVGEAGYKSTKTALTGSGGKYQRDENYRRNVDRVLRNHGIPLDWKDQLCNQGAYSFVNRVLFLRMYEDRVDAGARQLDKHWLELLDRAVDSEQTIDLLNVAFRQIRSEFAGLYNRPLFDGIHVGELTWKPKVVHDIVARTHEHDFSSVDSDVLGDVYQNHIPKEVRKALGQFYTSPSLVRYMIQRVSEDVDEHSKIIDPACGSGTFLIEMYRVCKERLVDDGWMQDAAHAHILSEMLYGLDLDSFATQLSTMNLLLRDLNNPETTENIVTTNSVMPIGNNLGALHATDSPGQSLKNDVEELDLGVEQSLFGILRDAISNNENNDGFNIVLGNPPYFTIAKSGEVPLAGMTYKKAIELEYEDVTEGRVNIATLFVKRGLDILDSKNGVLAFILPKPMVFADGYSALREYIRENCRIVEVTDIGKAWDEVGYEQVIMFLEPESNEEYRRANSVRVVSGIRDIDFIEFGEYTEHYIDQSVFYEHDAFPIYSSNSTHPHVDDVWETMRENSVLFKDLELEVFRGLGIQSKKHILSDSKKSPDWTPIIRGRNIGGAIDDTGQKWYIDLDNVDYVNTASDEITKKANRFYENKIICKRLVSSDVKIDATYDDSAANQNLPFFNYDTITNIINHDNSIEDLYLLGVLTSDALTTYLRELVFARAVLTMDLDRPYLDPLPIPDIPKQSEKEDVVTQKQIADTVRILIRSKKILQESEYSLKEATEGTYIESFDDFNKARRELQELVLKAYGLDDEQKLLLTSLYELDV
jgi:type I restriction-modification system DNA methylase subunit